MTARQAQEGERNEAVPDKLSAPPGRMVSWRKRVAATALLVLVAAYSAPLVWLAINQRDIVFAVSTRHVTPAEAGFGAAREVAVTTSDGESLVGWFVAPKPDKPFLIYLHGNAGTLEGRASRLRTLTQDGEGLLAIDWRGYGGSTGSPSQTGLQRDALAAYEFALRAGADPKKIVLVGESLGTGVAVWLAGERAVAGIVLDSPYSSIVGIGAARYWMFPVGLVARDPFPAERWARRVHVPIFAAAGDADTVIPMRFARGLVAAANEPKTFLEIPGAGHVVLGRPDVMAKAKSFIAGVTR
jgi:uncharacterized protein